MLERLYGKKQWNDHVDHPKSDQQGSGAISVAAGVQFSSTIPEEDRQYFLDWMKQVAKGGKPGDTLITSDVIAKLRGIDADPDLKAKVLAKLQAGGDGGERKPLTAQMLDNVVNAVNTDDAYQKLGMTPPIGGVKYKPLFSEPVLPVGPAGNATSRRSIGWHPAVRAIEPFATPSPADAIVAWHRPIAVPIAPLFPSAMRPEYATLPQLRRACRDRSATWLGRFSPARCNRDHVTG
jgi:hypothetical protein